MRQDLVEFNDESGSLLFQLTLHCRRLTAQPLVACAEFPFHFRRSSFHLNTAMATGGHLTPHLLDNAQDVFYFANVSKLDACQRIFQQSLMVHIIFISQ